MKTTCDLHDEFGALLEVLPFGLTSYGGKARFAGRVETVKCFEDNSRMKELSQTDGKGRVLVVDAGGSVRNAVMGDMIAGAFVENGWAGMVIWGAVRDVQELRNLPIGVLALGHIPRPGKRRDDGQIGIEVRLGECRITPGAYLIADEEGAVVLPKDHPAPDMG
ncbi:ribonuclease E activity regulator RraA [Actibacterium lipolyticum]|uniref:4-hydroxy-4-methyl-2-oxoglutarate aldolase n=1 Tax=Actibacterium lipolyticum TaxID=1524263 RepID=A0A238LA65_9RHOB|nr:ribonuclease E activity regulator RraA [Actibacterium lipolyticum]SMX51262.1 Putative regulator of ribonuclease activity [Actibacterium lipolyticum]